TSIRKLSSTPRIGEPKAMAQVVPRSLENGNSSTEALMRKTRFALRAPAAIVLLLSAIACDNQLNDHQEDIIDPSGTGGIAADAVLGRATTFQLAGTTYDGVNPNCSGSANQIDGSMTLQGVTWNDIYETVTTAWHCRDNTNGLRWVFQN